MANPDMTAASKPLACEIALYTEEELGRYLEENGRIVSVQDPENISREFIQRLRDIVEREYGATKSHEVDLDQVAARLRAVPDDREPFSRSPSLATTLPSPPQEEEDLENLTKEKQYYYELVDAGGRPPYPYHLLEEFFWHPEQYLEHENYGDIVFFYRERSLHEAERTCFCGRHLSRWRCFRRAQRIIRDRSIKNECTLVDAVSWDSWEAFVDRYGPKEGQWGFSEYAESVSRRLTKYGFTRPFQLDRDLDRQDKLTTWIEYLGYEYWFYDGAASFVKRFQRRHDEAWNKLVVSNVLGPDETYDVICNIETTFRHASEEERAEKDVKSAAAAVSSSEKALITSSAPAEALRKRLLADQRTLSAAREMRETLRTKNDAITAFRQEIRRYRCEKLEANRYSCLLRWIEQQIPSIELELSSLNSAEDDPDGTDSIRGLKRARTVEHDEAPSRKLRRAEGNTQLRPAGRASLISPPPNREITKRSRDSSIDNGRAPKRVKNSGQGGLSLYSEPGALASTTLAPIPDTRATQELEGGNASSNETVEVLKPLRRSARIAGKKKEYPMIAHVPPPLSPMVPKQSRGRTKATRTKRS